MSDKAPPAWISQTAQGVVVRVHAQPQASRTEIVGAHGEGEAARLKIRLAAPPVDGKANEELLYFLKKKTGIPSGAIELLRGDTSKSKDVLFRGASVGHVLEKLR